MVLTSLRMRRKDVTGFHKMASTNVSLPLHSLAEACGCRGGLFWRKCSLNECNLLHFSEIKWFRKHFGRYVIRRRQNKQDNVVDNCSLLGYFAVNKAIYYRRFETNCHSHRELYFVLKRRYQIARTLHVITKKNAVHFEFAAEAWNHAK